MSTSTRTIFSSSTGRGLFLLVAAALVSLSRSFSLPTTTTTPARHCRFHNPTAHEIHRRPSSSPTTTISSKRIITTRLRSLPTPIDTFTSGLASMARLPRGITVSGGISSVGPAASLLPTLQILYDIENDRDCRRVRERITELDLVVGRVVPASSNSRAVLSEGKGGTIVDAPTLVAFDNVDDKEMRFVGVDEILDFFDEKFSTEKEIKKERRSDEAEAASEERLSLDDVKSRLLDVASYLPGLLRAGRGSAVFAGASSSASPPRPVKPLILYSYESNQFCRLVREVLHELDIPYELRSAGKGSPRREELTSLTGGSSQCPYLIDPNTNASMPESKDIIEYLYSNYALWTPPNEMLRMASNVVTPLLRPVYKFLAPLQAGYSYGKEKDDEDNLEYAAELAEAKAEIYEEISSSPVVIYTYELSPFCTEAMALLKSIGVTDNECKQVSLGKEWIPGLITRPAKRAALLEMTGQSSLPNVFVGGVSVGGLFSGSPGLVPALERGELMDMVEEARKLM